MPPLGGFVDSWNAAKEMRLPTSSLRIPKRIFLELNEGILNSISDKMSYTQKCPCHM